jgi:hypothetical protein
MITLVRLHDAEGLNYVDLDVFPYPLQKFSWEHPITAGTDSPKPFSSGRYPSRKNIEYMTLDMEGLIVESTTSAYWVSRGALQRMALPKPVQTAGILRHCAISLQLDGDVTTYTADFQVASSAMPVEAVGSPTVSPFMFSLTCDVGYWTNQSTGELVRL